MKKNRQHQASGTLQRAGNAGHVTHQSKARAVPSGLPEQVRPESSGGEQGRTFFNRTALGFSAAAILCFAVLRNIYPVPHLIPDSNGYILGAIDYSVVGYRPMGISYFLRKMYQISPSAGFAAWAQFAFHLFSGLALVHAFLKLFAPGKRTTGALYAVCLLNPALLHLANMIAADSLFISLTLLWFALMLHLIRRPAWLTLAGVLVVFWLCMFVRYNAIIYPLAAITGILLSRHVMMRWVGTLASLLIAAAFYINTQERMAEATGVRIFSGFSGWQLASNAMKAYKAADNKGIRTDDPALKSLDSLSVIYIDSVKLKNPDYSASFETDFMWKPESPFRRYQAKLKRENRSLTEFQSWTMAALPLGEYGSAVIRQYPGAFFRYYLLPNAGNFFWPDLEMLAHYSTPEIRVFPQIRDWYRLPARITSNQVQLPRWYHEPVRWLYALLNIGFLIATASALLLLRSRQMPFLIVRILIFAAAFWVLRMGFEVFAAPLTLRYVVMLTSTNACVILMVFHYLRRNAFAGDPGQPAPQVIRQG